mmetsp:Transcript_600/g.1538  ORF Transcript_600/g.1538 Transcript_600/m.1538 type:complete len:242 (-) Transcript_600:194-919(-)|eukprot:CAMPEP_0171495600 /NCGR_PEP_ID=MMETSP0958-20121227/6232_1 /TAXON_ID=87120 /ORGANISM="Aurantiochytrium limacinum, Strain ATCCMYA-1381" /LENGTH=241 /DNA_ID=CAMNT_0012029601 /DNA_START=267 /DNA_END=992 /DNA_ORIENTATION=+
MPGVQMDTLNQRWANDKSKFGYKMLVKMGWTDGKGAGKNEDGRAAHVKVDKRADLLGLGSNDDVAGNTAFLGQISNFNDVLQSLNQSHGRDAEIRKEERRRLKRLKKAAAGTTDQVISETRTLVRVEKLENGEEEIDIDVVNVESRKSGEVDIEDGDAKKSKKKSKKDKKSSKKRSKPDETDEESNVENESSDDEKKKKKRKKKSKEDVTVARKVHMKLVRAKDVASYSRGDLNAILGISS